MPAFFKFFIDISLYRLQKDWFTVLIIVILVFNRLFYFVM